MKQDFSAKIITLREVYDISYKLAKIITQSAYQFDVVVAIARGGFPAARFICDFLNIRQLGSMQISHYSGGAQKYADTQVVSPANINISGKSVLVVDDVNDTGETLKSASDYIQSLNPALYKIAVLYEKSSTVFKADFVGKHQKKWKWLMYQWAVTEDILTFLKQDNMLESNEDEVCKHLHRKYNLSISKKLLQQIRSMKGNYY
ncbi:phosphoribosyltransferase [Legionella pneumophila serogroup 1]|uniref:Phosphoribosyltransferase n=1 Tax=Legionella pneumophila TaxID=446 RepID=A0A378K450_LEGPN|nr:phosphoribosyltransferase [Legionella pneumophila]ADG24893.1 Predicted phosphoribosyltransferase [Legionella pneumophila 2300/99 Alcoy]MCO1451591.1 phosphoribosyltransferase [Legionella pneumophila]MCW8402442.1 phosphoribosyltransferase [Legionella pneumophila]MCW8433932.1 phosphoribosyltransferase [Legionella pneumophila]MCW8467461.1 phosphoribosyltransferase [Legionella pneumophila]